MPLKGVYAVKTLTQSSKSVLIEKSFRVGHQYVTNLNNLKGGRVLEVVETRTTKILLDMKELGMPFPKLCISDGALGFWKAIRQVYPAAAQQRFFWVCTTGNFLDKQPKSIQTRVQSLLFMPKLSDKQ